MLFTKEFLRNILSNPLSADALPALFIMFNQLFTADLLSWMGIAYQE